MYLGGFQDEDDAARAYDLAALACKGLSVPTNFPAEAYTESLAEIGGSSRVWAFKRHTSEAEPEHEPVVGSGGPGPHKTLSQYIRCRQDLMAGPCAASPLKFARLDCSSGVHVPLTT